MAAPACVKTPFFMRSAMTTSCRPAFRRSARLPVVPEDVAALRPDIRVIGAGGQVVRGGIQASTRAKPRPDCSLMPSGLRW